MRREMRDARRRMRKKIRKIAKRNRRYCARSLNIQSQNKYINKLMTFKYNTNLISGNTV